MKETVVAMVMVAGVLGGGGAGVTLAPPYWPQGCRCTMCCVSHNSAQNKRGDVGTWEHGNMGTFGLFSIKSHILPNLYYCWSSVPTTARPLCVYIHVERHTHEYSR